LTSSRRQPATAEATLTSPPFEQSLCQTALMSR
jgi:hypothetical protein